MKNSYYISGCVFTLWHTKLSNTIQQYVQDRFDLHVVRCCMPNFKIKNYADRMPEEYQQTWLSFPNTLDWKNTAKVYTICHNCTNLIQDTHPDIPCLSLWELILSDKTFLYPDHHGQTIYVQDCWRSRSDRKEQIAVRALLKKMNFHVKELPDSFEHTTFCGRSFYKIPFIRKERRAPENHPVNTNPKLPVPTEEEQISMMKDYCHHFDSVPVVCYCHYCLEGLKLGGADAYHLAQLLFD